MRTIIEKIKKYKPYNKQEEADKNLILRFINDNNDAFIRTNRIAHITSSAWIVNSDFSKVLMVYHNIYQSWSWLGGHADGDYSLLRVAIEEAKEESGMININVISEDIFSLESLTVEGHVKDGQYVSSHLHLNITFLLSADENEELTIKENENSDIAWFSLEQVIQNCKYEWFRERIYCKLNDKLSMYNNKL